MPSDVLVPLGAGGGGGEFACQKNTTNNNNKQLNLVTCPVIRISDITTAYTTVATQQRIPSH